MKFNNKIGKAAGLGLLSLLLSFIIDKNVLYLMILLQSASVIEFFSYVTILGETLSIIFFGIILSIFIIRGRGRLLPLWITLITVFLVMFVMMKMKHMKPLLLIE